MCESCCGHLHHNRSNKVIPGHTDEVQVRKYGRINGWSCPLHPLQIIGWFFLAVFAITHFAILVFYLPLDWLPAGIIVPAGGYLVHLTYHVLALTLDPADPAVRVKGIFEKEVFDRAKQGHVIQNSFCYICQTKVSSSSKHCSMCNKCVFDFDHHCKWLNNCVGGRNYKLFLGSCISAFGTAMVMFIIDLYLLIVYYTDRKNVLLRSGLQDYQLFPAVVVGKEAYIVFDIVNGLLLLVALGLLGHLLIFHGYLICNKLSTYDYIVQTRERKTVKDGNSDVESTGERPPLQHTEHNGDLQEERIYEMKMMDMYDGPDKKEKNETTGRNSQHSYDYYSTRETSASGCERDARISTTNAIYEVPTDVAPNDDETSEQIKKRREKSRTPSRVELLGTETLERDDTSSIGSASSLHDSDVERYNRNKFEMVLEDFRTPVMNRMSTGPTRLSEEHTYEVKEENTRNQSVASRPRSPSPKQSQRASYVGETYLDHVDGETPSRSTEGESVQDKTFSYIGDDTEDSGIGKFEEINSPALSLTKSTSISRARYGKDPPSEASSQLSLSNALSSRITSQSKVDERENNATTQSGKSRSGANVSYSVVNRDSSNTVDYKSGTSVSKDNKTVQSTIVSNSVVINEFKSTYVTSTATLRSVPSDKLDTSLNVISEDDNLVFEDEFLGSSNAFVEQSSENANVMWDQGIGHSLPSTPRAFNDNYAESSDADKSTNEKLARYVEAFKQKKLSVISYGSDSEPSDMAIAVLNEESNPSALKDSLDRVNKLSDAFPTVTDQEKFKKRSLRQPRLRDTESMEELSVVEYNRKKKLKKKRPSTNTASKSNLPPLRVRKPTDEVSEDRNLDI